MTSRRLSHVVHFVVLGLLVSAVLSSPSFAAEPYPDAPSTSSPGVSASPVVMSPSPRAEVSHKFWDKGNYALFAASAAFSAADFAVTRANLQSGGQEMNPLVRVFGRSTPGLAMNFVGETAGVIGISYLFHKTSHHKLERAVSLVNIAGSAGAVSYGLSHR
jgi:hypothetical protein